MFLAARQTADMQFGLQQRMQLRKHWNGTSWFYTNLGAPARAIIATAYGITPSSQVRLAQVYRAQEDLSLAVSIFARNVGCDKSHVVHALLSGSIESLNRAMERNGNASSEQLLRDAWESAFRDIIVG